MPISPYTRFCMGNITLLPRNFPENEPTQLLDEEDQELLTLEEKKKNKAG